MQLKLDENLGLASVRALQQFGYDCERVTDEGLSGATDQRVWEKAQAERRLFITLDLDFADIRRFPPGTHAGLLVLRPDRNSSQAVLDILLHVVERYSLESFSGCLGIADQQQTRIRRPRDDA